MLYIPYDADNRLLRAKGFRVLCLCHLGLSQLDQAQEYINEAEKVSYLYFNLEFWSLRSIDLSCNSFNLQISNLLIVLYFISAA